MYTFKYLSFLSIVRIVNPLKQGLRQFLTLALALVL